MLNKIAQDFDNKIKLSKVNTLKITDITPSVEAMVNFKKSSICPVQTIIDNHISF